MTQNYWIVECLEDFLYYCCPECNNRQQSRHNFLQHAINEHPEAKTHLVPIIGNKKITVPKDFQLLYRPVTKSPPPIQVNNEFEYNDIDTNENEASGNGEKVSNSETEEEFVVEKIIEKSFSPDGKIKYLIKWKGYNDKDNSWEPIDNIYCYDLIEEFEKTRVFNCDDDRNIKLENEIGDVDPLDHPNLQEKKQEQSNDGKNFQEEEKVEKPFIEAFAHESQLKLQDKIVQGQKHKCDSYCKLFSQLKNFKCELCSETFSCASQLESHVKTAVHENQTQCKKCNKIFSTLRDLKRHILVNHEGRRIKKHKCEDCGKCLSTKQRLDIHIKNIHEGFKALKCEICGKLFSESIGLKRHIKGFHEHIKDEKCDECGYLFSTKGSLKKHIQNVHEGLRKYKCDRCDMAYKVNRSLQDHKLYVHEGQEKKLHMCESCGKSFTTDNSLKIHIQSEHEGQRDHKCDICGKSYSYKNQLKKHISTIHEGKRHICDSCGKLLRSAISLENHIKYVHENQKDDKCEYCSTPFSFLYLRQHEKICPKNTQKVGFICQKCKKSFSQNRTLKLHIKNVHEGRRDYKCGTCGKAFSNLSGMKKHRDTVHLGLKKYQCSFCNTAYGQNGDLSRHIKRCHLQEKQILEETENQEKI